MSQLLKLFFVSIVLLAVSCFAHSAHADQTIRFAMTPALLLSQHTVLADWRTYLESKLKRPVEFVQRDRYRETMDLLQQQKVDFAWICDYPYLLLKQDVRLLAVALNNGKPTYRAYLIVPARDTHTRSMRDLKGRVFAYTDINSNTGYLAPRFEVKRSGEEPATFFRRTFFTWSHQQAIEAVAAGLAQGASVDSYVWDALNTVRPALTAKTRIVWRSAEFGFPPIVARRDVAKADFELMQKVLLNMQNEPEGRYMLYKFRLDGFTAGTPELYDGVAGMMKLFGEH